MAEVVLWSRNEIAEGVRRVVPTVMMYQPEVVVVVPQASFIFAADLLRADRALGALPVFFINVLPTEDATFKVITPKTYPVGKYKRVLIIESCVESGATIARTRRYLRVLGATDMPVVCAVNKNPEKFPGVIAPFAMPKALNNPHIYGYGMDDDDGGRRGLPYIAYEEK